MEEITLYTNKKKTSLELELEIRNKKLMGRHHELWLVRLAET
jgi:hypothetical protein